MNTQNSKRHTKKTNYQINLVNKTHKHKPIHKLSKRKTHDIFNLHYSQLIYLADEKYQDVKFNYKKTNEDLESKPYLFILNN